MNKSEHTIITIGKQSIIKRSMPKRSKVSKNVTQCDTIKKGYIFMKWVFGASISLNKYLVIG